MARGRSRTPRERLGSRNAFSTFSSPSSTSSHSSDRSHSNSSDRSHLIPPPNSRSQRRLRLYRVPNQWIQQCAIFGDSAMALIVSLGMLCLSVYYVARLNAAVSSSDRYASRFQLPLVLEQWHLPHRETPIIYMINRTSTFKNDGGDDDKYIIEPLSDAVKAAYFRDGVIAVRGLLSSHRIDQVRRESEVLINRKPRKGAQFHTASHGSLFTVNALWEVSVASDIPSVAIQLLLHELEENESLQENLAINSHCTQQQLRVLRDIFLSKSSDDTYICGWHVDDLGFWPAMPSSPGINAWVALEENQASFALAVGSHRANWTAAAHQAIGSPLVADMPPTGYANASDYLRHRNGSGTCNLKHSAPHLHQHMEEVSRIYSLQPGDVIFHTRWLFHRSVVSPQSHPRRLERRYSIRYGPGTSIIPPGYGTELSVLWNASNGGQTADAVSTSGEGVWYPQAWPRDTALEQQERHSIQELAREKFPLALDRRRARESELAAIVRRILREGDSTARKQHQ